MATTPTSQDTLHEIEKRQDQVLAELDALEQQLTQLLAQFAPPSKPEAAPAEAPASPDRRLDRAA